MLGSRTAARALGAALPLAIVAGLGLPHACGADAAPIEPDGNMSRSRIPDTYKWNLDPLFGSDGAFEAGLADVAKRRKQIAEFKGKLGTPASMGCIRLSNQAVADVFDRTVTGTRVVITEW